MFDIKLTGKHSKQPVAEPEEEKKEATGGFPYLETSEEEEPEEEEDVLLQKRKEHLQLEDMIKSRKHENLGIWVESNVYFKNFQRINF